MIQCHVYEMINSLIAAAIRLIGFKELAITQKWVIRFTNKWLSWTRFIIAAWLVYAAFGLSTWSQMMWINFEAQIGAYGIMALPVRMVIMVIWQKFKKKISFRESIWQYVGWWVADMKTLMKIMLRSIRSDFPSVEVE